MNKEYEIYYEAFDIKDAEERKNFILDKCGEDKTLFDNIMRLFPVEEELEFDTYGKYEIVKQIGKGGMGIVYLANLTENFEAETFTKKVALKTINPQLKLEPKNIKIFLTEIKTLAELEHPNIARFLDIGTSEKGKPFFVMEYVEGLSVIEHCNKNKFSIKERLVFFRQILDAIDYSHGKGFIHCDIKPNNILVDSKGKPKVIDFGIASKYGSFMTGKSQTTFFQNAFTPNYASPEQIKGEKNLSETTDIYSLGVVFYELLTGQLPIELSESDSYPNMISTLEKVVPPTLKKSVTKVIDETERERLLLERDCRTISELKNNLSSNLDEIVQKALSRRPHKRYAKITDFDAEISNYLSEESFFMQIKSAFVILYKKSVRQIRRFSLKWAVGAVLVIVILFAAFSQSRTLSTVPYYLQLKLSQDDKRIDLGSSQKNALNNSINNTKEKVLSEFNKYLFEFESKEDAFKTNIWTFSNFIVALSSAGFPLEANRLDAVLNKNQTNEGCWMEERTGCKMIISGWVMLAKKDLGKPFTDKQLEFVLKNQSPEGWFPAYPFPDEPRNAATYPTSIIIWGLSEQLSHNLISEINKEKVQTAIIKGANWLLKTRKRQTKDFMWSACPNDNEIVQMPSSGLDGTIVFIIHNIAKSGLQIPDLAENIREIDSMWLNHLSHMETLSLEDKVDGRCNTITADGDIMDRSIRFTVPWSIIATTESFPSGTPWQKASAMQWLDTLPISQEYKGFNFGTSEHLIGLSYLRKNDSK
jgi:serine/threonine protein kinase